MKTTDLTVANTILEQLGGRRFLAMTGAKDLLGDTDSLWLRLPRTAKGINKIRIKLEPSDTYTVIGYRYRNLELTEIAKVSDVYCEALQRTFTSITGLDTHL